MRKGIVFTVGTIVVLICGWVGVQWWIFNRLENKAARLFDQLRADGYEVEYDTIAASPIARNLHIVGLRIRAKDSTRHFVKGNVDRLEINGIQITALIFNREVVARQLMIVRPAVKINHRKIRRERDEEGRGLRMIKISSVELDSVKFEVGDSSNSIPKFKSQFNLTGHGLVVHLSEDRWPKWNVEDWKISNWKGAFPREFYVAGIKRLEFLRSTHHLEADSIRVDPMYDRVTFARLSKKQIDQFRCVIPKMIVTGFEPEGRSFRAKHVAVEFHIEAFRNKHYPRWYRTPTILPMEYLEQLTFPVHIDSITVRNSYVSYEEVPENDQQPGKIFFNNLHATIYNVSNSSTEDAVMNVHCQLLNAGTLVAHFVFPHERRNSTVDGSLSGFEMKQLNAMLKPVAKVEVQSGRLKRMDFHFTYNRARASGNLEMSYSNLKVNSLKKDVKKSENKLLTFVINLFVKDNLDGSDSKDKRTGTIKWDRDPQRGVLNYWWKSLFSGVKDVFGLGVLPEQKKGSEAIARKK